MKARSISPVSRLVFALCVMLGSLLLLLAVAGLQVQTATADCDNSVSRVSVVGCTNVLISDTSGVSSDWYQRHFYFPANAASASAASAEELRMMKMQELKQEHLDRRDANSTSTLTAEKELRIMKMQKLKQEQLDRRDANSISIPTADEEDSYRTTQPSMTGWWEYREDLPTSTWSMYPYVTTPADPVIDAVYESHGNPTAQPVMRATYESSIFCPEPSPSCDQ